MIPKLSICISLYNYEHYIGDLLASIYDQDYRNIEIVVVDDASSDGSVARVEKSSRWSPFPVRLLRNEVNRGSAYTTRRSIAESTGDYFISIAADDMFERNTLARPMRRLIDDPQAACFIGNGHFFTDQAVLPTVLHNADKVRLLSLPPQQVLARLHVFPEAIWLGTIIYRRDFFDMAGGVPDVPCEDWGMHINMFRTMIEQGCHAIVDGDYHLLRYRMHDNSMSSDVRRHTARKVATIRKMTPRALWTQALRNNFDKSRALCEFYGQPELAARFARRVRALDARLARAGA
ncbi:MAG: glycosyltransferase family A protein [Pseudomonadota bacterium]